VRPLIFVSLLNQSLLFITGETLHYALACLDTTDA